jgi:hypothetical protein
MTLADPFSDFHHFSLIRRTRVFYTCVEVERVPKLDFVISWENRAGERFIKKRTNSDLTASSESTPQQPDYYCCRDNLCLMNKQITSNKTLKMIHSAYKILNKQITFKTTL